MLRCCADKVWGCGAWVFSRGSHFINQLHKSVKQVGEWRVGIHTRLLGPTGFCVRQKIPWTAYESHVFWWCTSGATELHVAIAHDTPCQHDGRSVAAAPSSGIFSVPSDNHYPKGKRCWVVKRLQRAMLSDCWHEVVAEDKKACVYWSCPLAVAACEWLLQGHLQGISIVERTSYVMCNLH